METEISIFSVLNDFFYRLILVYHILHLDLYLFLLWQILDRQVLLPPILIQQLLAMHGHNISIHLYIFIIHPISNNIPKWSFMKYWVSFRHSCELSVDITGWSLWRLIWFTIKSNLLLLDSNHSPSSSSPYHSSKKLKIFVLYSILYFENLEF